MLTPMYVGRAMACTHDHAPLSKRTSPMCHQTVHKCTLKLTILSSRQQTTDLRPAVSRPWNEVTRFDCGRHQRALGARRQGVVLHCAGRPTHGGADPTRVRRRKRGSENPRPAFHHTRRRRAAANRVHAAIRRRTRWPVSHEHGRGRPKRVAHYGDSELEGEILIG
jgi:hypothetical protein